MSKRVQKKKKTSRVSPSKPLESLVNTDLWKEAVGKIGKKNLQILDYHCGKGSDLKWLKKQGYTNATGYDPKYYPECQRKKHQIILCTYVLNKIDDTDERNDMLYNIVECGNNTSLCFLTSSKNKHIQLSNTIINEGKTFVTYLL